MPPFWQGLNSLKLVDRQDEIAFGNLQPRFELPGVLDLVDVDLCRARHRLDGLRVVVHVVPARRVVESADHVNAVGREHEVPVVEIVLIRGVHRDRGAGLLPRVRLLLRDDGLIAQQNRQP